VAAGLKDLSPRFNRGQPVNVVIQRLGYLVRCGDPDSIDSVVPMAFGNLAMDLVLARASGRLVSLHNGRYDNVPIEVVTGPKKVVDVDKYYNVERLRPKYETISGLPMFIMTSDPSARPVGPTTP
jgi:6-phosphofructokinase 1